MTESAFQEARKVMQTANYIRGMITTHKQNVSKWTGMEAHHIEAGSDRGAESARKQLRQAIERLNSWKKKFADLKFPDENLQQESSKVWISAIDYDSFNLFPKEVNKADAEKEGLEYFPTEQEAQKDCDYQNSL